MKKFLATFFLLLLVSSSFAQKERNYIYILDCSKSMLNNQIGNQSLWDATLDYLHKEIDRQTPSSKINIVPFQGNIFPTTQCLQSEFNWKKFYETVKNYPLDLTGTNICLAWDTALKMQDANKDNYIILMTDGEDTKQGVDAVCLRIRKWCQEVNYGYGYYVMLSEEATHPKIVEEVNRCKKMFVVDGKQGLKPFGSLEKTDFTYNTLEPKEMEVPVSTAGTFKAHIENDDQNFEVELVDNVIRNGKGIVRVTPKGDLTTMDQVMRLEPKLVGEDLNVLNPELNIMVNNMPERLLSLATEEIDAGEAEWYDAFLWSDARTQDTLWVDLGEGFNDAAKEAHSSVRLVAKSIDKEGITHQMEKQVRLVMGGQELDGDEFTLSADQEAKLGLLFAPEAASGKHYFEISAVPGSAYQLERINDEGAAFYRNTIRAEYDVDTNPWKLGLGWFLTLSALALALWIGLLRYVFFPRIKVMHLQMEGSSGFYKNPKIKGCRKVVFTNKRQNQSLLNHLFTGPIKYVKDDFFDSEWYITPGSKKDRIRVNSASGYAMNPPGNTLTKHESVTMKSNATGKSMKVTPC